MNIFPADFGAKAMYCVSMNTDILGSCHVVTDQETSHSLYLLDMLKCFNINKIQQVDAFPLQMNKIEKMYYKTVGRIFTLYISADPMAFDRGNLKVVCGDEEICCPIIDNKNLSVLTNYARQLNFRIIPRDPL